MHNLSNARGASVANFLPASGSAVSIASAPPAARFILRGATAVGAASKAFGVALPTVPCRGATNGERAAFWIGPDEWLLIAPEAETAALHQGLSGALAGVAHALVDVSHRQTALVVEGKGAATLLNAGTPLDLAIDAFPVGMVCRTIFDKAEIVLWRSGAERFRVEVWRSFAPYVRALLEAARSDDAAL
jgi:sarcosine oxidase, subunit gamma